MKIYIPRRSSIKILFFSLLVASIFSCMIGLTVHLSRRGQPYYVERFNSIVDGESEGDDETPSPQHIKALDYYDDSMMYKVVPFAFVGPDWSAAANMSVCIATHSSVNRIHSLAESLLSWKAATSVAVYAPDREVQVIQYFIGYLQYCYPEALLHVAIHLIHPVERPPAEVWFPDGEVYDCTVDPERFIDELLPAIGMKVEGHNETEIIYPQNILRNSAIKMCPTEWILTVDVDMLPQPSLHKRLEKFLASKESNCTKCAFVIPTYEVKLPNVTALAKRLPNSKNELRDLIKKRRARSFHIAIFRPNQAASKLAEWEKLPRLPNDDIQIAYTINYTFWYEPVFVAKRGFPLYIERFVGFGMTRNTQAYLMFLSGYQLKLLDNAFLTHWGFQMPKSRPAWRTKQTSRNFNIFKNWLLEMTIKYDADPLNLTNTKIASQEKRKFMIPGISRLFNWATKLWKQ